MDTANRREMLIASGAFGTFAAMPVKATIAAEARPARLSLNENAFGPSPAVPRAIFDAIGRINRYADDSDVRAITAQIAAIEQVSPEQIILGEILEQLGIFLAARAPTGGRFVYSVPGYTALIDAARPLGAVGVEVPLTDTGHNDLPALFRAIDGETRAVSLVAPHNPTGTLDDPAAFDAFVTEAARSTLVIVDEAYLDYDDLAGRSAVRLTRAGANVAVFRTFAKIYGLAGLPFGYTIAPRALADALRGAGIGSVHTQSRLALVAASVALGDRPWIAEVRGRTLAGRDRVTATLDTLGLKHTDSRANFVFFRSPIAATEVRAQLAETGIEVGRAFPPLDDWIRITIGTEAEVARSIAALNAIFSKARPA